MQYFFVLKNEKNVIRALSKIYSDGDGPFLNQNLAQWISHGFPECEGEDNGAGIMIPGDRVIVEWALCD